MIDPFHNLPLGIACILYNIIMTLCSDNNGEVVIYQWVEWIRNFMNMKAEQIGTAISSYITNTMQISTSHAAWVYLALTPSMQIPTSHAGST